MIFLTTLLVFLIFLTVYVVKTPELEESIRNTYLGVVVTILILVLGYYAITFRF